VVLVVSGSSEVQHIMHCEIRKLKHQLAFLDSFLGLHN
jgi:hypothetical protein